MKTGGSLKVKSVILVPPHAERRRSSLIFAILQGVENFQRFFSVAILLQPTFDSRNTPTTTRCRLNSFLDIGASSNAAIWWVRSMPRKAGTTKSAHYLN